MLSFWFWLFMELISIIALGLALIIWMYFNYEGFWKFIEWMQNKIEDLSVYFKNHVI